MEKTIEFLKKHWKAISTFLLACITLMGALLGFSSCGATTRATVRNYTDSNHVSVTISTNNPTNWNVSPNVDLSLSKDTLYHRTTDK